MKIYNQTSIMSLADHQAINDLPKDKVGKYFSLNEKAIRESQIINAELIAILDTLREQIKRPVIITSLHRTPKKQQELKEAGYAAASHSPHLYGCAADIDCKNAFEVKAYAGLLEAISLDLGIPIRIGYNQYLKLGQTFVHIDTTPLIFGEEGIYGHLPNIPTAFKSKSKW